jgi:pimeloyl-ACP methyl ester carboxylesterase
MATYILVHGSFTGAWCWREVLPRLESKGHTCIALEMPAHGKDRTPAETVMLEDYVRTVVNAITPLREAPILVGHSMTSIISQAAERIPSRIRALVYLAGLLLPNGSTMLDAVNDLDPEYLAELVWAADGKTARISPEGARRFLCQLCPRELVEEILPLLTAEPVAPFQARLEITEGNFGRVPRYYIECLQDRIIPIALQRKMHSALPCKRVYSIDTDHTPSFSSPAQLTSILLSAAEAESVC